MSLVRRAALRFLLLTVLSLGLIWQTGPAGKPVVVRAASCAPVATPSADVAPSGGFATAAQVISTFDNARSKEGCTTPLSINATSFDAATPQMQMLMLFNAERADRGLGTLQLDSTLLSQIDLNHSREMAQYNYFNHPSPINQPGPSNVFNRLTVNPAISGHWTNLGENIAAGYSTSAAAVYAYMYQDSSSAWGHRHNILGYNSTSLTFGTFNWVGVGIAQGGSYGVYYTSDFLQGSYTPPVAADTQAPTMTQLSVVSGTPGSNETVQAVNVQDTGASAGEAGITGVVFYVNQITMDSSGNANTYPGTNQGAGVWTATFPVPVGGTVHAVAVDGSGNYTDCGSTTCSSTTTSPTPTSTSTATSTPTSTSTPTPTSTSSSNPTNTPTPTSTPTSTSTSTPNPVGTTTSNLLTAVSTQQYTLTGNDGSTWADMDASRLSLTITPTVDETAILSGNADLFTSATGYNQDLGIWIAGGTRGSGQVVAWKESGGFAGTFSPNAAFVQTVVQLTAGTTYTIKLQWKANKSDPSTIWAGAGPINGSFSPTRLTARLFPSAANDVSSASSTSQYTLTNSDGSTWQDMDATNLQMTLSPTVNSDAILTGNADLFTSSSGYNQDLGIWISGGAYGSGQVVAWKESGGFAGTYSPNAAYVQTVVHLSAGTTYTVKLRWKANRADSGTIWAGAGPINTKFSPTRLTAQLSPSLNSSTSSAASTQQYSLTGSDGSTWQDMDSNNLKLTLSPTVNSDAVLTGNADLFTSATGYNQDIGIWISGGTYGTGQLVTWKESGGFAGTFSPNAAGAQAVVHLSAGTVYTVKVQWKANKADPSTIYAGAGPINGSFSPTSVIADLVPST